MSSSPAQQILDPMNDANKITNDVYNMVKDKQITIVNVIEIVIEIMQFIEKYPDLDGVSKKTCVINVITLLVSKDDNETLTEFTQLLLPSIIDVIIAASNNLLQLNKTRCKSFKSFFPCC
jgi:hypothetical protein